MKVLFTYKILDWNLCRLRALGFLIRRVKTSTGKKAFLKIEMTKHGKLMNVRPIYFNIEQGRGSISLHALQLQEPRSPWRTQSFGGT